MLYSFKNDLHYDKAAEVRLSMHLPQLAGKSVTVTKSLVSDECNYFDEWMQDRAQYGIGDDCFAWSPDDPWLDASMTLHDPSARALYAERLRPKYVECAKLSPTTTTMTVQDDGTLEMNIALQASNVLFLEIR